MSADRALVARIAAHTRWAGEPDRTAATAPARKGMEAKWAAQVDPDGVMAPDELARRIDNLRQAHMQRMALASAKARRARKAAA